MRETRFIPSETRRQEVYERQYDLICGWIPFEVYHEPCSCDCLISSPAAALAPSAFAFVAGPQPLLSIFTAHGLSLVNRTGIEDLAKLPLLAAHKRFHP